MSKKISSYDELLEEKARLQELLAVQKKAIQGNYLVLREEVRPITRGISTITSLFAKVGRRSKGNRMLNLGLDIGTELVLKRYFLAKAGWLTRTVVPFVVKNYSSHIINSKEGSFVDKIKKMFTKTKKEAL